jgi:hypothetical protein
VQDAWQQRLRHIAYAGGWKKLEPFWDWVIRAKRVGRMLPLLETVLAAGSDPDRTSAAEDKPGERALTM